MLAPATSCRVASRFGVTYRSVFIKTAPNRQKAISAELVNSDDDFVNSPSEQVKSFEDIPGPINLPIYGTLWQYKLGILNAVEYHTALEKLHTKYGPLCRENLAGNHILYVFNPDDFRTVFKQDGKVPHIKPLQESVGFSRREQGISPGLGNINGDEWLSLRTALRPLMLRIKEVSNFLQKTQLAADAMVERLDRDRNSTKNGSVPCLKEIVGKWLQESAGYTAFDRSLGFLDGGKSEQVADRILDASGQIAILAGRLRFSLPLYKYVNTPTFQQLTKNEVFFNRKVTEYVEETLQKVKKILDAGGDIGGRYPFMVYLLNRPEVQVSHIIQTTQSLISDALSTTRPAFLSCLHNLATNPEAQQKAYQEIKQVVGDSKVITKEMLGRLSYVKAAIKETFRLHPIGTEISRIIQRETVLSNYRIPTMTHIHLVPHVNYLKEEYFENPEEFIPERWLRGNISEIHPFLVIPFGHGPRVCAGKRFAEQDLLVGVAKILQRFELLHPDNEPMEFIVQTLITHKRPVRVQFVPRHS